MARWDNNLKSNRSCDLISSPNRLRCAQDGTHILNPFESTTKHNAISITKVRTIRILHMFAYFTCLLHGLHIYSNARICAYLSIPIFIRSTNFNPQMLSRGRFFVPLMRDKEHFEVGQPVKLKGHP
jgi:hypothetical protein